MGPLCGVDWLGVKVPHVIVWLVDHLTYDMDIGKLPNQTQTCGNDTCEKPRAILSVMYDATCSHMIGWCGSWKFDQLDFELTV